MSEDPKRLSKTEREARASRLAEEGSRAAADYASAIAVRDENMQRLRALRLARDAAASSEAGPSLAAPKSPAKKKVIRRTAR